MNIVKYDPFKEFRGLQEDMARIFSGVAPLRVDREEMLNGAWAPKVDIFENKDNLVLEAELPGMNRGDFELSFENNMLTLSGERKFEKKTEGDNYHRIERSYGAFTRSFTLPQTVTAEGARAEFNNGILHVTLAKREDTKARKIEVLGFDSEPKTIEANDKAKTAGA
ncbi:MAG: Hsp20/alpha crystallin family protein [Chloracidobacterium sp.]|nr:Hsp20/alpha crystallin family protein [Chloracidobacterium sp.]